MLSVFQFNDYRKYLSALTDGPESERGLKTRLAQSAGCQLAYLSQAIRGTVQLTPEHAMGISTYLNHAELERDYFLTLIDVGRAGTPALRTYLTDRLKQLKERNENLAQRYKKGNALDPEGVKIYYSNWHHSAIHILLTIPGFDTVQSMSQRLGLAPAKVEGSLKILEKIGLVKNTKGKWKAVSFDIHLGKDSPLIIPYHNSWRQQAAQDVALSRPESVHYTAVYSVSLEDLEKIKSMILDFMDKSRSIVAKSREEELVAITLDFFVP